MSISPEQFIKLVTKENLKEFEERIDEKVTKKIDKVLTVVEGLAKKHKDHDIERQANLAAHNRIQGDVNEVRKHCGLGIKHPVLEP